MMMVLTTRHLINATSPTKNVRIILFNRLDVALEMTMVHRIKSEIKDKSLFHLAK